MLVVPLQSNAVAAPPSVPWSGQGKSFTSTEREDGTFGNPVTGSDVPDVSTIRVPAEEAGEDRDVYYMVSTTMELAPVAPVLKSYDLVNWEIASYVDDVLETNDGSALRNGKSSYGQGQWASTIALHDGTYYVMFNSNNNGHSYLFTTDDIEDGEWTKHSYSRSFHDPSLFFDDANDGAPYVFYGYGSTSVAKLSEDLKSVTATYPNVIASSNYVNESGYSNAELGTSWEGIQVYYANGYYYALGIAWAKFGRQAIVFRSKSLLGAVAGDPYAAKIAVGTSAIAQGSFVSTDAQGAPPNYALLFRDDFPTGRVPVLVPVDWTEGDSQAWPSFGNGTPGPGQVELPGSLPMPVELPDDERRLAMSSSVVTSDEFDNGSGLALPWQWNHNPDNRYWSLTDRKGWLRLTTGHLVTGTATAQFNLTRFEEARNTLSQRTFAPTSSAETRMDIHAMKDGDTAGLAVYNRQVSYIGVRQKAGKRTLGVVSRPATTYANSNPPIEGAEDFLASVPLPDRAREVYVKADLDLRRSGDTRNTVQFLYSLDGKTWQKLGAANAKLAQWEASHFKGQRFGLFDYATESLGGHVDFDYYNLSDTLTSQGKPVDRADLDWLIAEAEGLRGPDYTHASWAAVRDALRTAKAVKAPSTQNQVDAPAQALNRAVASLVEADRPGPKGP